MTARENLQWDASLHSVDAGPGDIDDALRAGVITLADDIQESQEHTLANIAQSCLDEYTDWCNGNAYGVVVLYAKPPSLSLACN